MYNVIPGYIRTHPLATDRTEDMQDRVRNVPNQSLEIIVDEQFYSSKLESLLK